MFPRHARCVLSRLRSNGNSLLLSSYLSRIGRIENSSSSACGHSSQNTFHLIIHCPATDSASLALWQLFVSLRPLVQALGSCPASGAPWSSAMSPSFGRGRVTATREYQTVYSYEYGFNGNMTMVNYVPKKKKAIVLRRNMHHGKRQEEEKRTNPKLSSIIAKPKVELIK